MTRIFERLRHSQFADPNWQPVFFAILLLLIFDNAGSHHHYYINHARRSERIRLRIAYQNVALPEQSGEFCLLVSDAIGDALLICRARHSSSLLL
jgi:hypothetical protein